jgi:F-type H+-transporting ATPase subunit b
MPQIEQLAATYASQIFWLLITFGLVYFGIGKTMVPKIQATVESRDQRIAADLQAAEAARRQADATEEAWRAEMDQARAAAQNETVAAKARATAAFETQVKAADADLATRLAHHDRAVAEAKSAAMGNLQAIAADAARDLVAKLSGAQVSNDAAAAAVRKVMGNG